MADVLRAGCLALALLLAPISPTSATTVSFVWTGASSAGPVAGLGTSTVFVSGIDPTTLTLEIHFDIDGDGLDAAEADVEFDRGPDFEDELHILSFSELDWTNGKKRMSHLTPGISRSQESTGSAEGQLFGFEGVVFPVFTGPRNVTLAFARMVFVTNPLNVATDGDDLFTTNERDPFATTWCDNGGICSTDQSLIQARVDLIPEPTTLALLGLGLLALATSSRWRN